MIAHRTGIGSPQRLLARVAVVIAVATAGTFVTAAPASAHSEVSETRVTVGSVARTIYGPSIFFNLSELGLGCDSTYKATFTPVWRVSNVTSSSVYIDYMYYTFSPSRSAALGVTALLNGNNTEVWHGYWGHSNITSPVTKTYYFRKTVTFGSRGYVDLYQWFNFDLGSGAPGLCGGDKKVDFWLRRA